MKNSGNRPARLMDVPSWMTRAAPRGIARVPTHAVRPVEERRAYMRANLSLPMRLRTIAGHQTDGADLHTANVSSSGVFFHCPLWIEPQTPVEIEIHVLARPLGQGSVRMIAVGQIVRAESGPKPGWHSLALNFDDITFQRDEPLPSRFDLP